MVSRFSDVAVKNSKDDKLGFREYASGMISTIERIQWEDTPFTIGIFGGWGSGKTSLMKIMEEKLKEKGYKTIFFNSWEYGNETKPWIPFMIKVVDELFKDETDKKELIHNIFLFSTAFKKCSDDDTRVIIERVSKIEDFKKKITERAEEQYIARPSIKQRISIFIDNLIKKIKNLKKIIIDREKNPRRIREETKGKIIIFIDDLDRIPEKLIDFLNSLKIFLDRFLSPLYICLIKSFRLNSIFLE
jgi:nucleoside-triphosphatase THEP1